MIRKWYKAKKMELEMKLAFLTMIKNFMDEKKDIVALIRNIYDSIKDMSTDELHNELITVVADKISEYATNKD